MDVFSAFPKAIISGVWSIGAVKRGSVLGNEYTKLRDLDVIVDEGSNSTFDAAPNAEGAYSDILLYCKPSQLPTVATRALVSSYALYDGKVYYDIIDAALGKNQETGQVEHVELRIRQGGVVKDE